MKNKVRRGFFPTPARRFLHAFAALAILAGCQADEVGYGPKHLREVSRKTKEKIATLKMEETSPVLMRIFKEESVLEVWKKDTSGRYALLKSYDICKWSGALGPKIREGDRQAPEGYYTITPALMNPNSSYYLAFNTGFPNAFDRSLKRTGSDLMVHGACSSRGCYAMTDENIQEIYALARDAFRGGQKAFQLQAYPFKMTPENMARHIDSPHMPFWRMLKEGYDHFELTRLEPKVDVCGQKYVFNVTAKGTLSPVAACPALEQPEDLRIAVAKKAAADDAKMFEIAAVLAEKRKSAEERAILVAAREADRKRAEEERALARAGGQGSLFAFFGDDTPASGSSVLSGNEISTKTPEDGSTIVDAPVLPRSAPSALAPVPSQSTPETAPAVCPDGQEVSASACPQPPATAERVTMDDESILDRIGNWF